MKYGFIKVAAAVPAVRVADVEYNVQEIEKLIALADGEGVELVCFPELSLTGYTCQDLFKEKLLLDKAEAGLLQLLDFTRQLDIVCVVGLPVQAGGLLLNCAAVIQSGALLGVVSKTYLPNYNEFYEKRWFAPAAALTTTECHLCGQVVPIGTQMLFHSTSCCFAIELCEDLWAPVPPSCNHALAGAEIIFNLSASNELICKHQYLTTLMAQQSARLHCGYVYSSCGYGESTQDLVFAGNALVYENGTLLARSDRFSLSDQLIISEIDIERLDTERRTNTTFADNVRNAALPSYVHIHTQPVTPAYDFQLTRWVNPHPFVPSGQELEERCQEIFSIQTAALAKRLQHTHAKTLVIGISGGLDSTLALLVCVKTCDLLKRPRTDIIGITMPGFGTTDRTYNNAFTLMQTLGITIKEISIREACLQQRGQPAGRLRSGHRRPLRTGLRMGHIQRRPHVELRCQRFHPQDVGALPRFVGGTCQHRHGCP